jgi:hypothetical protein
VGRCEVATTLREVLAFPSIRVIDADLLNRVVEVDEATASTSLKPISSQAPSERAWASSPHSIDRTTVRRAEPAGRRSMMAGEPGAVGIDQVTIVVRPRPSRPTTRTTIRKPSAWLLSPRPV